MADKKISQLTALSAANLAPSTDVLAIVDTSATETKKIVAQDLVNGVLNVASAVGIGTASPTTKLTVYDATTPQVTFNNGTSTFIVGNNSGGNNKILYGTGAYPMIFYTNATEAMKIDASQNLGLGVTPSAWASGNRFIDVNASASYGAFGNTDAMMLANAFWNGSNWIRKNDGNAFRFVIESVSTAPTINWQVAANSTAGSTISFTQAMTLDASGRLLVGTTSNFGGAGQFAIDQSGGSIPAIHLIGTQSVGGGGRETGVVFSVVTNDTGPAYGNIAKISAAKENSTQGNTAGYIAFKTTPNGGSLTERGRFTAGGSLLVNTQSDSGYQFKVLNANSTDNTSLAFFGLANGNGTHYFFNATGTGVNTAASAMWIEKNSTTSRSINAGGTVNASGADYAEYMTKAGEFALAKGDVCGINADGKLTNVFANAISFVVKSTDPSYVGGDSWGAEFKDNPEGLEAARQKVDRIAFAGQVPVNVLGATPGQYIVPVNDSGAIKGVAVSNPTFEQYQSAVGKVIAVQDDGRALIIVKVA